MCILVFYNQCNFKQIYNQNYWHIALHLCNKMESKNLWPNLESFVFFSLSETGFLLVRYFLWKFCDSILIKHHCVYLLEWAQQGDSNKFPPCMFLGWCDEFFLRTLMKFYYFRSPLGRKVLLVESKCLDLEIIYLNLAWAYSSLI